MRKRPVIVLSLVERGWQAARECSLDLHRRGVCVIHLIKGTLDHAVHALIAPQPHIRLMSVARSWFWPMAWLLCTALTLSGQLRAVLVDNERSFRRLRGWTRLAGINVIMVRNGREGYEVWAGSRCIARSRWYQLLASHAARLDF